MLAKIKATLRGYSDHPHTEVRERAIFSQAAVFPHNQAVIVGDSRVEMLWLPTFRGRAVLNAGIGGSRLGYWAGVAPRLAELARPDFMIVALGVNDADACRNTDAAQWERDYRRLVSAISSPLVLVAPSPTENGAFDASLLSSFAEIVAGIASDAEAQFIPPLDVQGLTGDGVHFTPEGNRRLAETIR